MSAPFNALRFALADLLQQPSGLDYRPQEFVDCLWRFVHALADVSGGIAYLESHSLAVARLTDSETSYAKAFDIGQDVLKQIPDPIGLPIALARKLRESLETLKTTQRRKLYAGDIEAELNDLRLVRRNPFSGSTTALYGRLDAWLTEVTKIQSHCVNHHVWAIQTMWKMHEDQATSLEAYILQAQIATYRGIPIQQAAQVIVDELRDLSLKATADDPSAHPEDESLGPMLISHDVAERAPVSAQHEKSKAELVPCMVTLKQMAAIVNKTKRTLERLRERGRLPDPSVKGGDGRADEWEWDIVRQILEDEYHRQLPAVFPGDRFIR